MKASTIALIIAAGIVIGVTIFHLIHHEKYCKYKGVPGKSHCAKCGHRPVCQKYHKRKWQDKHQNHM